MQQMQELKLKVKKRMLNLIKGLKKHRITLTNEEKVIAAINNGFEQLKYEKC